MSNWFHEHDNEFSELQWPPQSPDLNLVEHVVVEHEGAADKSTEML